MGVEEKTDLDPRQPRLVLTLNTGVGQSGKSFDAAILNISRKGLLVKTDARLSLDDPIEVVLPRSGKVGARVVWSTDDLYGCSFLQPIDEEDLKAANQIATSPRAATQRLGVDDETLGPRIKRLRVACGYTMQGLADRVGVSKPTLWKWEGDQVRPRHETMQRLAAELGVSELELAYGAPGLGEAAALAEEQAITGGSLADIVRASRRRIAQAAGVAESDVEIVINWDSE